MKQIFGLDGCLTSTYLVVCRLGSYHEGYYEYTQYEYVQEKKKSSDKIESNR